MRWIEAATERVAATLFIGEILALESSDADWPSKQALQRFLGKSLQGRLQG